MAAVQAKSPWAATLGDSKAALAPAPGDSFSRDAASAARSSFFTDKHRPDFTGRGSGSIRLAYSFTDALYA
jgi:hypothetical protein